MERWKLRPAKDIGLSLGERMTSHRREGGLVDSIAHVLFWIFLRSFFVLFHRLMIRGKERLPSDTPFILIANHASHWDVFALLLALPVPLRDRTLPIAAGDIFFTSTPLSTLSAVVLNALPMWRKKSAVGQALQQLRERLAEGDCGYVLFPEGKRSRDGTIDRFKAGVGMLVCGTDIPVVPCHIRGAFESFPPDRHWPRPGRITVVVGEPMRFANLPNERDGWSAAAERLEERVRQLAAMEVDRGPSCGRGSGR